MSLDVLYGCMWTKYKARISPRTNMPDMLASSAQAWPQGLDLSLSALCWKAREIPDHGSAFNNTFTDDYDSYSNTYHDNR